MAIIARAGRAARLREWRVQLRLRANLEVALRNRLVVEFGRVGREAGIGWRNGRGQGIDAAIERHRTRLAGLLRPHYNVVFRIFGERLMDMAGAARAKDQQSVFLTRVLRWIELRINGEFLDDLTATTRRQLFRALDEAIADGVGEQEQVRRLLTAVGGQRTVGPGGQVRLIGRARAQVIARTETHRASIAAGEEAVESADIEELVIREWISVDDLRTRPSHVVANGQRREANKPFDVGGAKLMFPGDPQGPPEETVMCRCVVGYVPLDEI